MGKGNMTADERWAFLAEVRVGLLAVDEPGRGPLAVPIWYQVEGGQLVLSMDGASHKAELLRAAGRATLTVHDESLPYKYVSAEGPVEIGAPTADGLALAVRYLGDELGRVYLGANPQTADTIEVRITPEHWRSYDYAKVLG